MFSSIQGNRLKRDAVPTIFDEEQRESSDENVASRTAFENVEYTELFSQASRIDATSSTSKRTNVLDIPGTSTFFPKRLSFDEDQESFEEGHHQESFEEDQEYFDSNTQTSSKLSSSTPRKQALKLKIRSLKRKRPPQPIENLLRRIIQQLCHIS